MKDNFNIASAAVNESHDKGGKKFALRKIGSSMGFRVDCAKCLSFCFTSQLCFPRRDKTPSGSGSSSFRKSIDVLRFREALKVFNCTH